MTVSSSTNNPHVIKLEDKTICSINCDLLFCLHMLPTTSLLHRDEHLHMATSSYTTNSIVRELEDETTCGIN